MLRLPYHLQRGHRVWGGLAWEALVQALWSLGFHRHLPQVGALTLQVLQPVQALVLMLVQAEQNQVQGEQLDRGDCEDPNSDRRYRYQPRHSSLDH